MQFFTQKNCLYQTNLYLFSKKFPDSVPEQSFYRKVLPLYYSESLQHISSKECQILLRNFSLSLKVNKALFAPCYEHDHGRRHHQLFVDLQPLLVALLLHAVDHQVDQIVFPLARLLPLPNRLENDVAKEASLFRLEGVHFHEPNEGRDAGQEAEAAQESLRHAVGENPRGVGHKERVSVGKGFRVDAESAGGQGVQAELAEYFPIQNCCQLLKFRLNLQCLKIGRILARLRPLFFHCLSYRLALLTKLLHC